MSELDEDGRVRHTSFNSSVKKTKDEDNYPPQVMLSKVEESVRGSRVSLKLPESTLIPINCSEITNKEWDLGKELAFMKNLESKMIELYKKLVYFDEKKTNRL